MLGRLSAEVATKLVAENEGRTAKEIIVDGLDRGIIGGTVAGQQGALVKLYSNGRLVKVRRDKQQGRYRYYLKGSTGVQQAPKSVGETIVTFRPTYEQEEILTAFTETRTFSNRSEVVQWLLNEGISSKRGYIDEVMQIYREIERLRREVQQIAS